MPSIPYKSFTWIIPFASFALGYLLMGIIYPGKPVETPALVGKAMPEAIELLSENNLNLRIIAHKIENDLPEGTIISQTPPAHSKIKQNQSLFCVVSKRPELPLAPDLINKSKAQIEKIITQQKIRAKLFYVASQYPADTCVSQYPANGAPLVENSPLLIYLSQGDQKPVLWPNFKGSPIAAVQEFLSLHGIQATINHTKLLEPNHHCTDACTVADQRPVAGSIIMLNDPGNLSVQLQVSSLRKNNSN